MLVKLQAQCQQSYVSFKDFAYHIRTISRATSVTKNFDLHLCCMSQSCMTFDNCTPLV